jgi:hypothetical protein
VRVTRWFALLCVVLTTGCIAAFRVGDPQPEITAPPGQAVPASIGVAVEIHADASEVPAGEAEVWKQKVWEGAEQSRAFGTVHRSARPDELRAEVAVYVTRTWSNTIGGLLTLFVIPAVQRTDLRMITTVVRADGTRLTPLTETGSTVFGSAGSSCPFPARKRTCSAICCSSSRARWRARPRSSGAPEPGPRPAAARSRSTGSRAAR